MSALSNIDIGTGDNNIEESKKPQTFEGATRNYIGQAKSGEHDIKMMGLLIFLVIMIIFIFCFTAATVHYTKPSTTSSTSSFSDFRGGKHIKKHNPQSSGFQSALNIYGNQQSDNSQQSPANYGNGGRTGISNASFGDQYGLGPPSTVSNNILFPQDYGIMPQFNTTAGSSNSSLNPTIFPKPGSNNLFGVVHNLEALQQSDFFKDMNGDQGEYNSGMADILGYAMGNANGSGMPGAGGAGTAPVLQMAGSRGDGFDNLTPQALAQQIKQTGHF